MINGLEASCMSTPPMHFIECIHAAHMWKILQSLHLRASWMHFVYWFMITAEMFYVYLNFSICCFWACLVFGCMSLLFLEDTLRPSYAVLSSSKNEQVLASCCQVNSAAHTLSAGPKKRSKLVEEEITSSFQDLSHSNDIDFQLPGLSPVRDFNEGKTEESPIMSVFDQAPRLAHNFTQSWSITSLKQPSWNIAVKSEFSLKLFYVWNH